MTVAQAQPTQNQQAQDAPAKACAAMEAGKILVGQMSLQVADPEVYSLVKREEERQRKGLELIASENFTSRAVMECVGSCLTNKYSEGLPGKRYYGGNEVIDEIETLCQKRALEAFRLDPKEWGVNVQSYSGSTANFSAFTAMLNPGDRVMGLNLPDGGHLSHGFYTKSRAINASSMYFTSLPYYVDKKTGLVDYDDMEKTAHRFLPKMIVCGGSAYPRDWDYERVRAICDKVGAKMLVDMAHFAGLVAGEVLKNPFQYADLVTTTTHKSLRSTRAALIFYRSEYGKDVNMAVFPGVQGGPHNHAIAGVAVQLREVATPEFKEYARQVVANCKALARSLQGRGYQMCTGGTDTHLILWDLRPMKLTGSRMSSICDYVAITLNKNTVAGDKSAMVPGGVRVGTPALTTRGFVESDFEQVADFLHEACQLGLKINESIAHQESKKLKDFKRAMKEKFSEELDDLKNRVEAFADKFPMPGAIL